MVQIPPHIPPSSLTSHRDDDAKKNALKLIEQIKNILSAFIDEVNNASDAQLLNDKGLQQKLLDLLHQTDDPSGGLYRIVSSLGPPFYARDAIARFQFDIDTEKGYVGVYGKEAILYLGRDAQEALDSAIKEINRQ